MEIKLSGIVCCVSKLSMDGPSSESIEFNYMDCFEYESAGRPIRCKWNESSTRKSFGQDFRQWRKFI